MRNNEFWVMCKKKIYASSVLSDPGHLSRNLPSVCIVEVTQDELVYIWPSVPCYDSLCEFCQHQPERSEAICSTNIPTGYPCQFHAVPEAAVNQDFDDFLIDGDYLAECGYFHSFADFKRHNGYTEEDYLFLMLGYFPSVRAARQALTAVLCATKNII